MYKKPSLIILRNGELVWIIRYKKNNKIYQCIFKSYKEACTKMKEVHKNE